MDASSVDYDVSDKASTVTSDKSASEKIKRDSLKIYFESKDSQDNRKFVFRCKNLEDAKKRRWMMIHRLDIAEGNILYGLVAPFYGIQK
jgi:hypothetical protein